MIADEIRQLAGKKNKSADWYINALENALSPVQDPDISTSDTGWVEVAVWCSFHMVQSIQKNMSIGTYNHWHLYSNSIKMDS